MGFIQATKNYYFKCIDFRSRISRSEYWWGWLGSVISTFLFVLITSYPIVYIISSFGVRSGLSLDEVLTLTWTLSFYIFIPVFIFSFIASASLATRRFHDINKSGWWLLIICIPYIGIIPWLYWMVKRGDEGANRFGPNPLTEIAEGRQ